MKGQLQLVLAVVAGGVTAASAFASFDQYTYWSPAVRVEATGADRDFWRQP